MVARVHGYAGYHRHLQFELAEGLKYLDSVDTSQLMPGTHNAEVSIVRHVTAGNPHAAARTRVTFIGLAGRTHVHEFYRREVDDIGLVAGVRVSLVLERVAGVRLALNSGGRVCAVDCNASGAGVVVAVFESVEEAHAAADAGQIELSRIVLVDVRLI